MCISIMSFITDISYIKTQFKKSAVLKSIIMVSITEDKTSNLGREKLNKMVQKYLYRIIMYY